MNPFTDEPRVSHRFIDRIVEERTRADHFALIRKDLLVDMVQLITEQSPSPDQQTLLKRVAKLLDKPRKEPSHERTQQAHIPACVE